VGSGEWGVGSGSLCSVMKVLGWEIVMRVRGWGFGDERLRGGSLDAEVSSGVYF
jgi:hypothetical protein